ncbi:MAG: ATP-binding protein [Anaerovibrio sp.]|uniref:ATP-binding protein n=1 Tax=Anaerovibrio sp. TaxID=1872532 RepID=UPI002E785BFA|nr:ATP-binding protein [Anaerovibrio sp.]MEE1307935.1 ATP-binding protein [Anaerovibrio sp.]
MDFTQSNNDQDNFYSQLMDRLLEEAKNGKTHTLEDFVGIAARHYDDIYEPEERDAATRKRYAEVFGKAYMLRFQHKLMTGDTGLLSCVSAPKQNPVVIPANGLPIELQNITLRRIERMNNQTFTTSHHAKICRYIKYLTDHIHVGTGLIIFGTANNIKSYYGASIVASATTKRHTAFYANAPEIFKKLVEWEHCNTEKYAAAMNQLLSASVLVLDKLGEEGLSTQLNFKFRQIVLKRYEEKKPVIILTSLSPKQLMFYYHADIVQKLQTRCKLVFFEAGKHDSVA